MALLVALPVMSVLYDLARPTSEAWSHVAGTLIPRYIANTLWLALGVGVGTTALGVGAAWLVVTCRFFGRRIVEWALILPLALPSYVLAQVYYRFLNASGPVQSGFRDLTGWSSRDYWFPDIASLEGAVFVLTLALYPYVYLAARTAFLLQAGSTLEVSRMLGCTQLAAFFRVMLPLARPAIAAGLTLVLMETLAEFGAVSLLGVQTFTTGIFRAWFSMGDRVAAAQLATMLLGFVFLLVILERVSRRGLVHNVTIDHRFRVEARLGPGPGLLALLACLVPVTMGFLLPVGILLEKVIAVEAVPDARFIGLIRNTLVLAAVTSALAVVIGLVMVYGARLAGSRAVTTANRLAGMGYALPGPVIAIGILVPLAAFDNMLDAWMGAAFGISTGLLLTGGIATLVFAYLVRFMALPLNTIEAGFTKIRPSLEDAASMLGTGAWRRLLTVHAPLIWPSLGTAALYVFVDVMKELPATLILRPFDFDTLAVRTYNLARDERIAEAGLPALVLVGVGLLPVIVLSRQIAGGRR